MQGTVPPKEGAILRNSRQFWLATLLAWENHTSMWLDRTVHRGASTRLLLSTPPLASHTQYWTDDLAKTIMVLLSAGHRDWFKDRQRRVNLSPTRRFLEMGPGRDKTSISYGSKGQRCRLGAMKNLPQHMEKDLRMKLTQREGELISRERKNHVLCVSGIQLGLKQSLPLELPVTWAKKSSSLINLVKYRFFACISRWIPTNSLPQEHRVEWWERGLVPVGTLNPWTDDKDTTGKNAELQIFSPCSHFCVIPMTSV